MLQLIEDIKVIDYHPDTQGKPRLWMNSGTVYCQQFLESSEYSKDAFIPIEDWRNLSLEDQSIIYASTESNPKDNSRHIGIMKIPEAVLDPLEDLGVSFITNPPECQWFAQQSLYPKAIQAIADFVRPLSEADQPISIHTITTNAQGLRTVTYNYVRYCFIGLHLDSWDKLSLDKRHRSTNRICINLGLEDRYFLFINITLIKMFRLTRGSGKSSSLSSQLPSAQDINQEALALHPSTITQIEPASIRQMFLEMYPHYPVIKIRVSPGEAYIAPTENMIHDASTLGKKFCDVILTIRGHFQLP